MFAAQENTTVLPHCLSPDEGLKQDLPALIFLYRAVNSELVTPSFLFLSNLPFSFPCDLLGHLSPAVLGRV